MSVDDERPTGRTSTRSTIERVALGVVLACLLEGCAPKRIALPGDPGAPLSGFDQIHAAISDACRGVRTLTGELRLSGRAGDQPLRGTVLAAFSRPASMRLDLRGPFGMSYFILTANAAGAALLLTQEERVVRDRSADQILGALTGVTMSPDDLQAVLTGCVVPSPRPVAGRLHAGGWASIDLDGGATLYLRRSGDSWRLRAARRGDWLVEYPEWSPASPFPARVWLQSAAPVAVDLIATMSQVETNTDLDEAAFAVVIPQNARPLTLEELRESGPLRER